MNGETTSNLAQNLKMCRVHRHLDTSDVAQILRTRTEEIVGWEEGETLPSVATLVDLSNQWELSLDCLLFFPKGNTTYCKSNKVECPLYRTICRLSMDYDIDDYVETRQVFWRLLRLIAERDPERRADNLSFIFELVRLHEAASAR